jgi:hypothetical protein
MSYRNKVGVIVAVIAIFLGHPANAEGVKCDLDTYAKRLFSSIVDRAAGSKNLASYTSDQEHDLVRLAAINSKLSNQKLADLANVYMGEASNEILAELLTRKGKEALPYLLKAQEANRACKPSRAKCLSQADKLVGMINSGEHFQIEDQPIGEIDRNTLCKESKSGGSTSGTNKKQ